MEYPFWEVPLLGGGMVIALIAIVHVFVSHFAVGGGLFLVLTERKARREKSPEILHYVRSHSRFFILLTLVFGAITGVGIWFAIALAHPAGTSLLIHNFVFGWAIEWCFFVVEIAAALLYYYGWDRLTPRTHLAIGWIYFVSAYMSLVVINGILSFMLTPGRWLEHGGFWNGFFNPSYFPSLLLRTGVALSLTGLYTLLTASLVARESTRGKLVRYAAKWVFAGFAILPVAGLFYLLTIGTDARHIAFGGAPPVGIFLGLSLGISLFLLVFTWLLAWRMPARFSPALAALFLVVGFVVTATSEWVREAVRKPYVVHSTMYSNGIRPEQVASLGRTGLLPHLRWARGQEIGTLGRRAAGEELFRFQCASCHTIDGYNGIRPLIRGWRESFLAEQLRHLDELKGYMPPFAGTDEERRCLAHFLAGLWGFPAEDQPLPVMDVAHSDPPGSTNAVEGAAVEGAAVESAEEVER
ncbi:MAG: cytochrome ubiquinol oxidase subunit I [Candidatus Eisenbacteria bacterium]